MQNIFKLFFKKESQYGQLQHEFIFILQKNRSKKYHPWGLLL